MITSFFIPKNDTGKNSKTERDTAPLTLLLLDLADSRLCWCPTDVDKLVPCYNTTPMSILGKHAPLKSKVIVLK